jgi:hypothetical protein
MKIKRNIFFFLFQSDNDTDLQCDTTLESLEHLFVKCDEVQGSHILQIDILHNCLVSRKNYL